LIKFAGLRRELQTVQEEKRKTETQMKTLSEDTTQKQEELLKAKEQQTTKNNSGVISLFYDLKIFLIDQLIILDFTSDMAYILLRHSFYLYFFLFSSRTYGYRKVVNLRT
jgi:hypothetical protein